MKILAAVTSLLLAQSTFKIPERIVDGSPESALCDLEGGLQNGTHTVELAGDVFRLQAAKNRPAKHKYKVKAGECYALFAAASSATSASTPAGGAAAPSLTLRAKAAGVDETGSGMGTRAGVDFCAEKSGTLTVEVVATETAPVALGLWKLTTATATIGLRPSVEALSRARDGSPELGGGFEMGRSCFFNGTKSSRSERDPMDSLERIGR